MPTNRLRITNITEETPDARSFTFAVPPALAESYRYRAGQFLTFRVIHPDGSLNRCYSLSSAPELDTMLKVTVKRVHGGRASNWFHDALRVGDSLEVTPPAGRFVCDDGEPVLLFFAGGSGITPIISLIKSALKASTQRLRLYYANRDEHSVIFYDELNELQMASSGRLEVMHHLDDQVGLTTGEDILIALKEFEQARVYICGPGPFMKCVEKTLFDAGVPRDRVCVERFSSSTVKVAPVEAPIVDDVIPDEIAIIIDGNRHIVPYRKGQTILEAAREASLSPPFSCEEGFCGSCVGKRIKATVELVANDVFAPDDLASGWILTCQSHCYGPVVEITYDVE
jgi:3-ketosteroid 9alpha-monooxygenase subunit B